MSAMNPLKFVGGMILEIGAVVAVLAILPGLGSRDPSYSSAPDVSNGAPNQVFYDARSSRLMPEPAVRPQSPVAWQSDLVSPPPVAQQRYVESTLDQSSQRALDAAARIWKRGDQLLPPELQVRREPVAEPFPELPEQSRTDLRPSHYAPPAPRFNDRY